MGRPVRIKSYYAASAHPAPDRAELETSVDCDVCVIGGGIAGCSAALHLAESGYKVILLEEYRVGWGASGRSGAQAIHGVASGQTQLEKLIGATAARTVWDVSIEGLALMKQLINRHQIACDWADGYLLTALKPRHLDELRTELDELQRKQARLHERTLRPGRGAERPSWDEALCWRTLRLKQRAPASAQLHPRVGCRCGTPRSAHIRMHPRDGISPGKRDDGRHGAYQNPTRRGTRERFSPVRQRLPGQRRPGADRQDHGGRLTHHRNGAAPGADRARELIANNAAVCDMNWVLDYYRLSADHRLLFGGRVSHSGFGKFNETAATRERMLQVFPQLADVRIDYSWGGQVDLTRNRAPHFGRLASNIYFLQGFSGHGIALTGIAGKLVAQAIAGTAERFDVFAQIPHRNFPIPALRRPALALAMLYYRLQDRL